MKVLKIKCGNLIQHKLKIESTTSWKLNPRQVGRQKNTEANVVCGLPAPGSAVPLLLVTTQSNTWYFIPLLNTKYPPHLQCHYFLSLFKQYFILYTNNTILYLRPDLQCLYFMSLFNLTWSKRYLYYNPFNLIGFKKSKHSTELFYLIVPLKKLRKRKKLCL